MEFTTRISMRHISWKPAEGLPQQQVTENSPHVEAKRKITKHNRFQMLTAERFLILKRAITMT
jgi:hypothetical protein